MKVPLCLFLLLCVRQGCSEASVHQADVPPEVHHLWDQLSGLKELVLSLKAAEVEQRQALRGMESQLRDWQEESERQRRRLDRLEDMLLHQPEQLLTEPDASLRRRVENLEEQSEGGSVRRGHFLSSLSFTTDGHQGAPPCGGGAEEASFHVWRVN